MGVSLERPKNWVEFSLDLMTPLEATARLSTMSIRPAQDLGLPASLRLVTLDRGGPEPHVYLAGFQLRFTDARTMVSLDHTQAESTETDQQIRHLWMKFQYTRRVRAHFALLVECPAMIDEAKADRARYHRTCSRDWRLEFIRASAFDCVSIT